MADNTPTIESKESDYAMKQDFEILRICAEFDAKKNAGGFFTGDLEVGQKVTLGPTKQQALKAQIQRSQIVHHEGTIKYIGDIHVAEGTRIGIELSNAEGKHNGFLRTGTGKRSWDNAVQYFETEGGACTGVFVKPERIIRVNGRPVGKKMSQVLENVKLRDMHGRVKGDRIRDWHEPICVVECSKEARPGYNSMPAHEYEDDYATLEKKVELLAELIVKSKKCCIYSGAGLSTGSGIKDYASKAGKNSKINAYNPSTKSMKDALPNIGHRTFAKLAMDGQIESWVQQNHDGLPQKAGFPQHRINEIHGGWFDPSNVVVPMKGTLREDLCSWLNRIEDENDLVIAVGTSLCGMTADDVFVECCKRQKKKDALGGVIIGLQQTQHDSKAYLRIFARINVVVALLARKLNTIIPPLEFPMKLDLPENAKVSEFVYRVPYDSYGRKTRHEDEMVLWDLSPGAKVQVTQGSGEGFKGEVIRFKNDMYWQIELPCQRQHSVNFGKKKKMYTLGVWWIETATKGLCEYLPVVNIGRNLKNWNGERILV